MGCSIRAKERVFDSPTAQIKLSILPPASGSRLKWEFGRLDFYTHPTFPDCQKRNVFHLTCLHHFHSPGITPNF